MSIRQWIAKWVLGIDVEKIDQRITALEMYILEKEMQ